MRLAAWLGCFCPSIHAPITVQARLDFGLYGRTSSELCTYRDLSDVAMQVLRIASYPSSRFAAICPSKGS